MALEFYLREKLIDIIMLIGNKVFFCCYNLLAMV